VIGNILNKSQVNQKNGNIEKMGTRKSLSRSVMRRKSSIIKNRSSEKQDNISRKSKKKKLNKSVNFLKENEIFGKQHFKTIKEIYF